MYMDYGSSNEESQTVIMGGGFDYGSTMILGSDQGSGGQVSNHVVKNYPAQNRTEYAYEQRFVSNRK